MWILLHTCIFTVSSQSKEASKQTVQHLLTCLGYGPCLPPLF